MLACTLDRWIGEIGDPGWAGWGIVALYLVAAGFSLRAGLLAKGRDERVFWLIAAGLMAVYAVNKELDLQTILTSLGRCASKSEGWHDRRWMLQLAVTAAVGASVFGAALMAALRLHRLLARTGIAAAGLVLVAGYVMGRVVIINHVDQLAGLNLSVLRLTWLFEVPGPLLIIAGASVDQIRRTGRTAPHTLP